MKKLDKNDLLIKVANCEVSKKDVEMIRLKVFGQEQHISKELILSENKFRSVDLIVYLKGIPVATGRITIKHFFAKFEKIATLKLYRGYGIGKMLMERMIKDAWEPYNCYTFTMDAQTRAIPFYEKLGWVRVSDYYTIENISHAKMIYPKPSTIKAFLKSYLLSKKSIRKSVNFLHDMKIKRADFQLS